MYIFSVITSSVLSSSSPCASLFSSRNVKEAEDVVAVPEGGGEGVIVDDPSDPLLMKKQVVDLLDLQTAMEMV